jgi:hypothetical protein
MKPTIEVVISPKGETVITTKGYAGASCLHASKSLEEALGKVASERKTTEFFQADAKQEQRVCE